MQPRGGRAAEPAPPSLPQSSLPPAEAYISAAPPYSLQKKGEKSSHWAKHDMPFCQAPASALHCNNIQSWKSEQSRSPTYLEAFHQGGGRSSRRGFGCRAKLCGSLRCFLCCRVGATREPAPTDPGVTRRISFSLFVLSFIAYSFAISKPLTTTPKSIL